jgi:hypothetical protein
MERVKEDKYGGCTLHACIKTQQLNLLKLFYTVLRRQGKERGRMMEG